MRAVLHTGCRGTAGTGVPRPRPLNTRNRRDRPRSPAAPATATPGSPGPRASRKRAARDAFLIVISLYKFHKRSLARRARRAAPERSGCRGPVPTAGWPRVSARSRPVRTDGSPAACRSIQIGPSHAPGWTVDELECGPQYPWGRGFRNSVVVSPLTVRQDGRTHLANS